MQVLVGTVICDINSHFTTESRIVCRTRPLPYNPQKIGRTGWKSTLETGRLRVSVQMFSGIGSVSQAALDDGAHEGIQPLHALA